MKLITLHQPWASLIALGLKQYETRHWSTEYRGPLLIHAAKRKPRDGGWPILREVFHLLRLNTRRNIQAGIELQRAINQGLPLGEIVAICDLSNCQRMASIKALSEDLLISRVSQLEQHLGNWEPGRYAFKLTDVQPLPTPIPFISRQGKLLDVPPSLTVMVMNQLSQLPL